MAFWRGRNKTFSLFILPSTQWRSSPLSGRRIFYFFLSLTIWTFRGRFDGVILKKVKIFFLASIDKGQFLVVWSVFHNFFFKSKGTLICHLNVFFINFFLLPLIHAKVRCKRPKENKKTHPSKWVSQWYNVQLIIYIWILLRV